METPRLTVKKEHLAYVIESLLRFRDGKVIVVLDDVDDTYVVDWLPEDNENNTPDDITIYAEDLVRQGVALSFRISLS